MKVLKKEDVKGWKYKHTCHNCDSELEVEPADLNYKRYDGDVREPGYDSFGATCAVCSASFDIIPTKIPKLVQIDAKNRASQRNTGGYFER